jgi:glutaredoxin
MESKECPFCDKVIEAYSKKQVEYYLRNHIMGKHKDKVVLTLKDKEGNVIQEI